MPAQNGKPASIAAILITVWAVANITVAYLPVSFNRKMLMGTHIPLSILAAISISWFLRNLEARQFRFALAGVTAILFLTNARFMAREVQNFSDDRVQSR